MLDELNDSFMNLDNSVLLAARFDDLSDVSFDERPLDLPSSPALHYSPEQPQVCQLFSTTGSSGSSVAQLHLRNPRYAPLQDGGKLYRYEDDPAAYRRIRK